MCCFGELCFEETSKSEKEPTSNTHTPPTICTAQYRAGPLGTRNLTALQIQTNNVTATNWSTYLQRRVKWPTNCLNLLRKYLEGFKTLYGGFHDMAGATF